MFDEIKQTINQIPKGKVATYGQIATLAGHPGAARQVVWALQSAGALPWHRVLGAGGRIRLPGHRGLEQRMRLEMEGVRFFGLRVDMKSFAWQPADSTPAKRGRPRKAVVAKKDSTQETQKNGNRRKKTTGKKK
jgi:methylated-DNA-protein-cysteine methyltransferase-like protein